MSEFLTKFRSAVAFMKIGFKHGAVIQRANLQTAEELLSDENIDAVITTVERVLSDPEVVSLIARLKTQFDAGVERVGQAQADLIEAVEAEEVRQSADEESEDSDPASPADDSVEQQRIAAKAGRNL